jgi:hypothetical protein
MRGSHLKPTFENVGQSRFRHLPRVIATSSHHAKSYNGRSASCGVCGDENNNESGVYGRLKKGSVETTRLLSTKPTLYLFPIILLLLLPTLALAPILKTTQQTRFIEMVRSIRW